MKKVDKELLLLLFLVGIAAMIRFLVASQAVSLVFYFLPTLYSAYYFGRRHATLTACASVALVGLLTYLNPALFNRRLDYMPFDNRWFDITVWGGVLVVSAYAMGTLYERNQKINEAGSFRVSSYAVKIAETLGLDSASTEDLRTASLLRNVNEIGISNEILYKAANLSQEELEKAMRKAGSGRVTQAQLMGGSLRRAIPILVATQELHQNGASPADSIIEVQILNLAEKFDSQLTAAGSGKIPSAQVVEKIAKDCDGTYDSMIVDAFVKAFGQKAMAVGN
ncbi:MAG TPA: hypothetical protein VK513_07945 [Terriglobales bacterium]|nr:hypothetical protein [Terriglobales bacterium]